MQRSVTLLVIAVGVFALGIVVGRTIDAKDAPSPSVTAYMEGIQQLDGQAVWDARSTSAQDEDARELYYREHGAKVAMSEEDRRAYREKARQNEISFFNQIRDKGGHIDHLRYYGGHSTGTSGIYVFETINHLADGDLDYLWAVMTDRQGKVYEAK
jgi:hypothetical protein